MNYRQKEYEKFIDNVVNKTLFSKTSLTTNFILFRLEVLKHNNVDDMMYLLECSASKISMLKSGKRTFNDFDTTRMSTLHEMFIKRYIGTM